MAGKPRTAPTTASAFDGRRAEIANAAAEMFVQGGVGTVSMDDIAREVGLAKPTLYHYFSSKDEILYAIHEQLYGLMLANLQARRAAGAPPEEQIRGIFIDTLEHMDSHLGHTRVVFEHLRQLEPTYQKNIRKQQRKYEALVHEILDEGIASGVFRAVDVHLAALAMFGMANWSYQWYSTGGKYRPDELGEFFYNLFMQGLAAPSPAVAKNGRSNR